MPTKISITVSLTGAEKYDGKPTLPQFLKFCGKIGRCLRIVEGRGLTESQRMRLLVSDLRHGSAVAEIEAFPADAAQDRREEIVADFEDIVRRLQNGLPLPCRLRYDELRDFRDIAGPLKNGAQAASIGGVQITSQFSANIDKILEGAIRSKGYVTGRLERLNVHNANEFSLFPLISEDEIICTFQDPLWSTVESAIKATVTVFGTLTYQPDMPFPEKARVESIEKHPPDEELPTLVELRGLFGPQCTDGKSASDFIRALRNEEA